MAQFLCLAYVLYRQWFLNQGQHIKACKLALTLDLKMCNNPTHCPIGTCLLTYYYLVTICKQKQQIEHNQGAPTITRPSWGRGKGNVCILNQS